MKKILACLMILSFLAIAAGCATTDSSDEDQPKKQPYEGVRPVPAKDPFTRK